MLGRTDRRGGRRIRARVTALIRPSRRKAPILLQVIDLGDGGAQCRTPVPLRLGATFHADFLVDGKWTRERPRVLRAYCRVVWTAVRIGPSRPIQEIGLSFVEMNSEGREALRRLLGEVEAA